jgi:hypothetical protein
MGYDLHITRRHRRVAAMFAHVVLTIAILTIPIATAAPDAGGYQELFRRYHCAVVDRLEQIYELGDHPDQDAFLIIDFPDRPQDYVQCAFDSETKILCEASSGFFFTEPRSYWLPPEAVAALGRLGFSTDDSAGNFRIWIDVTDPPDLNAIADIMLKALHDGYGARADRELRFNAPLAPDTTSKCIPVG